MYYRQTFRFTLLSISAGLCLITLIARTSVRIDAGDVKQNPSRVIVQSRMPEQERYPYKSRQFTSFVTESMRRSGTGDANGFYSWMDKAYRDSGVYLSASDDSLDQALASKRQELNEIKNPSYRAEAEIDVCERVHKLIKVVIPRFSLDRGFEFSNVVKYGERQCFLQSVLIAGLLQGMGMDAGVEMVYKNERGAETNNGHAICLVKLSNGRDIIVDASDKEPFARQRGLFVKTADYRYVDPVYGTDSSKIIYYNSAGGDDKMPTYRVRTLGVDFLHSQFWYYRGERVEGGLLSSPRTPKGLAKAREDLQMSVKLCPDNPLAVYMLGRVYLVEGNKLLARKYIEDGYNLYSAFGFIPQGPREYYLRVKSWEETGINVL